MSRVTKTSTPMAVQVMAILLLVMQNTPALLDMQCTLVLLCLAGWQVPNQVASRRYTTTVRTNARVRGLLGLVLTAKHCRATGTSTVSKRTVYWTVDVRE